MLCFDSEKMNWYYHVLARRPYLVVVSIAVYCVACIIVAFLLNDLPDFSDPTLGFETRGTEIGKRLTAWHNLDQEVDGNGVLFSNPTHLMQKLQYDKKRGVPRHQHPNHRRHKKQRRKHKNSKGRREHKKNEHDDMAYKMMLINKRLKATKSPLSDKWMGDNGVFRDYEVTNDSSPSLLEPTRRSEEIEYGHNTTFVDEDEHRERVQTKKSTWRMLKQASLPNGGWSSSRVRQPIEGSFCDSSPHKEYSHFVVQRIGPNSTDSLFDLNGMLAMCQLQEQIGTVPSYQAFCEPEMLTFNCCRPWSLPNYATLLANKSSCFDLTTDDVSLLRSLLLNCYDYFHYLKLDINCNELNRCYAPEECTRNNLVFNVLNFLSDHSFIKPNDTNVYLKYAMIFVPVARSNRILPLFHEWQHVELCNELVEVVAMDLGLENELFSELLLTDVWLVSLGGLFVMACVWLYTGSAFITLMSSCAICFSLGLAYFVYTLVFELSFFPYMNLLAIVVIIGIGADDVFLFLKIWQCVLAERFSKSSTLNTQSTLPTPLEHNEHTETLENLMALTMRHAAASMFVTSVTTASAFYASYSSSITAIKCFGIFAGTVVVTNYLLMITWLPASVSIMERLFASHMCCQQHLTQKLINACKKSINRFCELFEECITQSIMSYAYLWLFIFAVLGVSSAIIVFWYPGLQLPEKPHFQLFVSQHPFEAYTKLRHQFWFEKPLQGVENFNMSMRFVWGVQAVDDGDFTNPSSYGNLHYDNNFNISSKTAQIWLRNFCQNIRQQPFYQATFGFLLPNCFIENFIRYMERRCVDDMDSMSLDRAPCCDAEFPYEPHIFEECLPQCISNLCETSFYQHGKAGPKFAAGPIHSDEYFEGNSNESLSIESTPTQLLVKAIIIEFDSNVRYSTLFANINQFYESVETWFQQQLSTAPLELRGGWFISDLKFYSVQDTLSHDTIIAIGLAMAASLVVLLCFTLNFIISIYAVITVSLTIFNTVAVLILLGWRLNILESIAVSTAIGLAVDFSLHYGIHYRLSPSKERIAATQFALSRIIGPTVMAATTTGVAGGIMMASNILPYIQIGIFLVVVMATSWFYATFFLMSLLKVAGPQYDFMQLGWPAWRKRRTAKSNKFYERKPSQIIATEQLLTPTSSAIVEMANSETHELESLNSNNQIRTISGTESGHPPPSLAVDSFQTTH
ncbi:protein dispatched isoform X2 [Drosophila novamexicana]|uniref:protein dispatched isoform X2 n=1 Tax=Drosophila novamexicana TaxID=47314 RepID=UPI0011E5F89E|nr:protein dispatched isoform X2 [Drosophila novamexicana]